MKANNTDNKDNRARVGYVITHIGRDGLRQITFPNQARHHYDNIEDAQRALEVFRDGLRDKVLGDAADTLEVRAAICYAHGDAVGIYFD